MTSRKDGKEYESMVLWVYKSLCRDERLSSVEHDVRVAGPDGERQIDVLVRHVHAGIEYITAIECRDYSGKLSVKHVDEFASKIIDIKASKGVIVSRKGFSKTAIQKARRIGISLCSIDSADTTLKDMVVEIPIIVKVIEPTIRCKTLVANDGVQRKIYASAMTTINDTPLRNLIIQELRDGTIPAPDETKVQAWVPKDFKPPYFVRDATGEKVEVIGFEVNLHLSIWYLLGNTDCLPDSVTQTYVGSSVCNVFVPDRFKVGLNSSFARYDRRSDIPINYDEVIVGIFTPEADSATISEHEAWLWKPEH